MDNDNPSQAQHIVTPTGMVPPNRIVQPRGSGRYTSVALVGLFILAVVFSLDAARVILVPLVFAVLAAVMLFPIVEWFHRRLRLPYPLGSAMVIIALIGAIALGGYLMLDPARAMMDELPDQMRRVEWKLRGLRQQVAGFKEAGEQIEQITTLEADESSVKVRVAKATVTNFFLGQTWFIITNFFLTVGLLYFLLAVHNLFVIKLIRVMPTTRQKRVAVTIVRHVKHDVAGYFLTITIVNIGLGVAVGLTMWALGMPTPAVWGVLATCLNFVPFLGAVVGVAMIAFTSLMHFDEVGYALLPPVLYYTLTSIEGSFITPMVLGRRLVLNPVVIFLSLIFWGWLWGIPGIFLAVPIMSTIKILSDNIPELKKLGVFLGR